MAASGSIEMIVDDTTATVKEEALSGDRAVCYSQIFDRLGVG